MRQCVQDRMYWAPAVLGCRDKVDLQRRLEHPQDAWANHADEADASGAAPHVLRNTPKRGDVEMAHISAPRNGSLSGCLE